MSNNILLSFAKQDRWYAENYKKAFERHEYNVSYHEIDSCNSLDEDLNDYLYRKYANYFIVLISEHYVKKLRSIYKPDVYKQKEFKDTSKYFLLVRLDKTHVPQFLSHLGRIDYKKALPDSLVDRIENRNFSALTKPPEKRELTINEIFDSLE